MLLNQRTTHTAFFSVLMLQSVLQLGAMRLQDANPEPFFRTQLSTRSLQNTEKALLKLFSHGTTLTSL